MAQAGPRRRARELALQILFQLDVQPALSADQAIELYFRHVSVGEADGAADLVEVESRGYAEALVRGVKANLEAIDGAIGAASRNWRLERMARVDRNLLRLGAYEIIHAEDVPGKVAINEAIEIAKRFGTAESSAFVNGILDRILSEQKR